MILNYIFIAFFVVSGFVALGELIIGGDWSIFERIVKASFEQSRNGFEISLYLTGVLSLWLGFMRIAESSGLIQSLAHKVSPVLRGLFPTIPQGHPVLGNIFMNISANMLGLDNAATPLGLKTMNALQELNPQKDEPSDAMNMFIAINASGLTIIPTSIIAFRLQAGASNPADVFIPILATTMVSTLVAISLVSIRQKINLLQKPLLSVYAFVVVFLGLIYCSYHYMGAERFSNLSSGLSAFLLVFVMLFILLWGLTKGVNVYDNFIEGAKDGFTTAIGIVPYLVAMLVAIGAFRASGAMDLFSSSVSWCFTQMSWDTEWLNALPTMLMKPLSGSGARGLMVDAMQTYGADSFVGRLSCMVQGASDTTFYVIALYLGSIGIKRSSYVLSYSLLADLSGMIVAVLLCYLFFA